MNFVPKKITENVNISKVNPVKRAAQLAAAFLIGFLIIYWTGILVISLAAPYLPLTAEEKLGEYFSSYFESKTIDNDTAVYLNEILDRLRVYTTDDRYNYQIYLLDSGEVNAYAVPGGKIMICTGLLSKLTSEQQLAFVIGHEIGHFENRDHIKKYALIFYSTFLNTVLNAVGVSIHSGLEMISNSAYSRNQETKADLAGLRLVAEAYNNVNGVEEFFEKLKEDELHEFSYFYSSHPELDKRIMRLIKEIYEKKYPFGPVIPLKYPVSDTGTVQTDSLRDY